MWIKVGSRHPPWDRSVILVVLSLTEVIELSSFEGYAADLICPEFLNAQICPTLIVIVALRHV